MDEDNESPYDILTYDENANKWVLSDIAKNKVDDLQCYVVDVNSPNLSSLDNDDNWFSQLKIYKTAEKSFCTAFLNELKRYEIEIKSTLKDTKRSTDKKPKNSKKSSTKQKKS